MKLRTLVLATASVAPLLGLAEEKSFWPPITKENQPATRWWWMGSAVNQEDLSRELQRYHDAGLGGVEITTIYGVHGYEDQFIDFLSAKWMEMLTHASREAHRLDMRVDMPTGSGWCFGGPNVSDVDANATVVVKTFDLPAWSFAEKITKAATQALVAFSADGKSIDLTDKISADGSVALPAQAGTAPWRVYAISQKPSGVKVKRPAPGGAGWMLNLLQPDAMDRYLKRFEEAFGANKAAKIDAMFHDSYEYKSDWAPDFFAQFEKRRGYRLQTELPAFFDGKGDPDHVARVKSDYRETVSDLIEESITRWTKWAHGHGWKTRNQAHGSPGNWLDIYAASDIPETEMFYKDRDILVSKFASSAAHVTGKNVVGAEAGTWVAEHFTETLADLKYLFDDMFLSGVNRLTYHGTAYSPDDAPWPGWCFYASTEMNPRNSIWRDAPALNAYLARVQSVLQSGQPDNDVLLYWPIHDFWHNNEGSLRQFTVHARDWFDDQALGKVARQLWSRGYTFDYVSDEGLSEAVLQDERLRKYRAIVVPPCEHMPLETLRRLDALSVRGPSVIFVDHLPGDVAGLHDLEKRRAEFKQLIEKAKSQKLIGDLEKLLGQIQVRPEALTQQAGLQFVRRAIDGQRVYFVANRGTNRVDAEVPFATRLGDFVAMDPMTGQTAPMGSSGGLEGMRKVHLQLEPGESLILRETSAALPAATAWHSRAPSGEPTELRGTWSLKFLEGGPVLPKETTTDKLVSWTELDGEEAQNFGGTARYTLTFDAPETKAAQWSLDLGQVCQSARVKLNGRDLGTVFIPPFRVRIDELKPKGNVLEIEVTSTSANRIRDLDRRKVKWKNFYDINIVNLNYKPFDASEWPLADAGLLGPVTLTPLKDATRQ